MDNLMQAMKRLEQSIADKSRVGRTVGADVQGGLSLAVPRARVLTSAAQPLFNLAIGERRRRYLRDSPVRLPGRRFASYRGEELAHDDWAVWSQLLNLLCAQQGEKVDFAVRSFLKTMGWGASVHDCNRLRACLERMQATSFKLSCDRPDPVVSLSLIERCEWQPSASMARGLQTGRWRVWIAPEVQALFTELN